MARDDEEASGWVTAINAAIDKAEDSASPRVVVSIPPSTSAISATPGESGEGTKNSSPISSRSSLYLISQVCIWRKVALLSACVQVCMCVCVCV